MNKHTPTPYQVGSNSGAVVAEKPEGAIDPRATMGSMKFYGGYIVAESCTPSDAAFIVEACNAYEDLKRTLAIIREERDGLLRKAVAEAREKKAVAPVEDKKKGTS